MGLVVGLDRGRGGGPGAAVIHLASSSPRRRLLLRRAGARFRTAKPDYEEKNEKGLPPRELVRRHAWGKAISSGVENGTVLAADTVVFFKGKIIGKPKNLRDARRILRGLQGSWHAVWTGVAVVEMKEGLPVRKKIFAEKTLVKLRRLTEARIRSYLRRVRPLDKAGAYAIQSKKPWIVEAVRGSVSNAVGLPMEKIRPFLRD